MANMAQQGLFVYKGRDNKADATYVSGECAMITGWWAPFGAGKRNAKFTGGIGTLPYYPDVPGAPQNTTIGGACPWAVSGKKPAEVKGAALFFKYLSEPQVHPGVDGEFIVIVGHSGCGKSKLLRMVAGLKEISGGKIAIGGRVVNQLEPSGRDIAMVFRNCALYPHMSVFDNMACGLKIASLPAAEIKARVDKAAKILELLALLERKPRQLSGGQRQRVAMGRAIVRQPQVFLLDEPLPNLDAKLRAQTRIEIRKLHAELGVTSLFVTHDQVEAMTLAQRVT